MFGVIRMETEPEKPNHLEQVNEKLSTAYKDYSLDPGKLATDAKKTFFKWKYAIPVSLIIIAIGLTWQFTSSHYGKKVANLDGQLTQKDKDATSLNNQLDRSERQLIEVRRERDTEVAKKEVEITRLTSERDNALHRVALLESMPTEFLKIYTNIYSKAPTNFTEFSGILTRLTNAIDTALVAPEFAIYVNNKHVTDDSALVRLTPSNGLFIQVENTSKVSTDNLEVTFITTTEIGDSMDYHGWARVLGGGVTKTSEGIMQNTNVTAIKWRADSLSTPEKIYSVATISFKPPIPTTFGWGRIIVSAPRAQSKVQAIVLQFDDSFRPLQTQTNSNLAQLPESKSSDGTK
jgi:hypothetical protein